MQKLLKRISNFQLKCGPECRREIFRRLVKTPAIHENLNSMEANIIPDKLWMSLRCWDYDSYLEEVCCSGGTIANAQTAI
jgi:hypothetical protein